MHIDARPTRTHKDRDTAPQPTDIAEKMVALQRKRAGPSRPKERTERVIPPAVAAPAMRSPPSPRRQPPSAAPQPAPVVVVEPISDDFSRRLKISGSPRPAKLFNPDTDAIPIRRTAEPEAMSDSAGSSHASKAKSQPRQLFDYRRDDPVRFSVQARKPMPTAKSSGDYASVSSASSSFTLSSNSTTDSSTPSSIFDRKPRDESKTNAFSAQLKKLYRDISALEAKILQDSGETTAVEDSRVLLKGSAASEELEKQRWKKAIDDHKSLAEMMHNLLAVSLAYNVPASLRNIPVKYNIIVRLWSHAFHRLLENLRRSSLTSKIALEHLQDFIYYAYTFYTGLLEEESLTDFRPGWLEALGDLARYRMAIASMVPPAPLPSSSLTAAAIRRNTHHSTPTSTAANASGAMSSQSSEGPAIAAHYGGSSPSVGIVAARLMEIEPEKERWRTIARDWYAAGVSKSPGNGKLHHHLGLLSREGEGEELRSIYHFVKSMIAIQPFETSRESILSVWSPAAQARRSAPDARAPELFVLLHGMLFTNIQLDDFSSTLARLLERLEIDSPEAREWTMMAAVNIGALLEYGRPAGMLRKTGVLGIQECTPGEPAKKLARKVAVQEDDRKMDVDGEVRRRSIEGSPKVLMQTSPALSDASMSTGLPPAFKMAQQLTFAMLAHGLDHSPSDAPGPYITVLLTFLPTIFKNPQALGLIERMVPWESITRFMTRVPRRILKTADGDEKLTTGSALPEDWSVRGMAWTGRNLFERGYWAYGEGRLMEMEMLDERDQVQADGTFEDADEKKEEPREMLRWLRAVWAGSRFANIVNGFRWDEERRWWIEGPLAEKVAMWAEEDRVEREEDERRKRGTRWADGEDYDMMDVDEEMDVIEGSSGQSSDDDETDEVKTLKARRRYLQSLQASQRGKLPSPRRPRPRPPARPKSAPPHRPSLYMRPGYTILVLDTNILLSSLSEVSRLVESNKWTVVIPLPVIMELDGLSTNITALGDAAKAAMEYLTTHIRPFASCLKVQTSRGNYLSSLNVRSEQVDFDDPDAWERNMDDLILKATIWQDEHWQDRSAYLRAGADDSRDASGAAKVVLLSLDRNLRLKARSRQLSVATEKDLGALFAGTS